MALTLDRLIDRLIADAATRNEAALKQARFSRYLLVTTLVLSVFYAGCMAAIEYPVGIRVLLSFVVVHVSLVGLLVRGVSSRVVGHLYCIMALTGFVVLCLSTYGIASPTFVWFVCPVVSSFWLIGRRAGYCWSAVSIGLVLAFFGAGALGRQFPLGFPARYYYIYAGIAYTGALLFVVVVVIVYENWQRAALNLAERLARELQVQKQAAEGQRDELGHLLQELQAAQQQLIQKEKMASLGELTAGIAHEIQNPLNFVNNFAEVSQELLDELAEAPADPALAAELLADLRDNLGMITQHGRRAAGIVRSMLEHSRASGGEHQPTNLNALAEEYGRLAYHGQRARDPGFQAAFDLDLAANLPPVPAAGADLGRVLLNLVGNACYAVRQRQLASSETDYQPRVRLSTRLAGREAVVQVQDNGTGMAPAVQAKIFQPFFTTKPSGEGTGLGLSLSHDIVVQGHGGTLAVESCEGEGSTFTLRLPLATAPPAAPAAPARFPAARQAVA